MSIWQAVVATATPFPPSLGRPGTKGDPIIAPSPEEYNPAFVSILRPIAGRAAAAWRWLEHKRTQHIHGRRLRVSETISLGEKRFVAILQVDGAQFLIGGSAGNVSLLAVLEKEQAPDANTATEAVALAEAKQ